MKFHNVGLPGASMASDSGRTTSALEVRTDPFNCMGEFSDNKPTSCFFLMYLQTEGAELAGAFKSPSLRGVAQRPPFTHTGQFPTLHDLLVHYNKAPAATVGKTELKPLSLTDEQLNEIEAFLQTLNVN